MNNIFGKIKVSRENSYYELGYILSGSIMSGYIFDAHKSYNNNIKLCIF